MKILMIVLTAISSLALVTFLIIWLLANGSGHRIPAKTNWTFGLYSLGLLLLVLLFVFLVRKKRQQDSFWQESD
jgi:LPXTG-motif cell wall-anchored protein